MSKCRYDVVIVGAGPNGLSAGITLARAGLSVLIVEARPEPGGAARTAALVRPDCWHDVGAAVHPMGLASPFLASLPLTEFGLSWCFPPVSVAHPFSDGSAVGLDTSGTLLSLMGSDSGAWRELFGPLLEGSDILLNEVLRPLRVPTHPLKMGRFGMEAMKSCRALVDRWFTTREARALFAGCAAHSAMPLEAAGTASFGIILALTAQQRGWPFARGGSGAIISALVQYYESLGGRIECERVVRSIADLPESKAVLFSLTPRQLLNVEGLGLPPRYRSQLSRFKYGPGVFKVDWLLSAPIPWAAAVCRQAGTVHIGDGFDEIAEAEASAASGRVPTRPFVLLTQPSIFDDTRAPPGVHVAWAYCHVPHRSQADLSAQIETQVERFAPGFKDSITARHVMGPLALEAMDANLVGGDIGAGANSLRQLFARPVFRLNPYSTPNPRVFVCSASTPPGGGVHGMCGYWAAQSALASHFR